MYLDQDYASIVRKFKKIFDQFKVLSFPHSATN